MSNYYLTEAYSYLYTSEEADQNIFQNLRFMDYLQQEEVQEILESLIWEFMDYGDSLDEAVSVLETTFSDDDILCESLDLISEARAPYRGRNEMERRREMRQRRSEADAELNKRLDDRKARARRAERAAAIRGALSGAKKSVEGALAKGQQYVTNKRSQLAAQGARLATKAASSVSSTALQGLAALSKIARIARGTASGAVQGARQAYNTPSVAPSSRIRIPTSYRREMRQARARSSYQDIFGTPSAAQSPPPAGGTSRKTASDFRTSVDLSGRRPATGFQSNVDLGSSSQQGRRGSTSATQTPAATRLSRAAAAARSLKDKTKQQGRHIATTMTPPPPPPPPPRKALPPAGGTSGRKNAGRLTLATPSQLTAPIRRTTVKDVTPPRKALPPAGETSGRTTTGRQTIADPWQSPTSIRRTTVKDVTPPRKALPPAGGTSGSTKKGHVLSSSQRQTKNMGLSRRQTKSLNASVDYDLLAQYMIEDIIDLGYAINEDDAIAFMESMDPSVLNQFANIYLED